MVFVAALAKGIKDFDMIIPKDKFGFEPVMIDPGEVDWVRVMRLYKLISFHIAPDTVSDEEDNDGNDDEIERQKAVTRQKLDAWFNHCVTEDESIEFEIALRIIFDIMVNKPSDEQVEQFMLNYFGDNGGNKGIAT